MKIITLRPATVADAEMIFEWRDAPETRRYFFNPEPLQKADHLRWFEHSLKLPSRCLLIAESEQEAIGVLRYDLSYPRAEIDIYLRPGLAGQGLGTQILEVGSEWMKQYHPDIKILQAKVIADNRSSARAFEKAGFEVKVQVYEKNIGAS